MSPPGINEFDVLTGRDQLANSHPGNKYFRSRCRAYRKRYISTKTPGIKSDIILTVISEVRERGGRFMSNVSATTESGQGEWVEMDSMAVKKKVSHSLRQRPKSHKSGEFSPSNAQSRSGGTERAEAGTSNLRVRDQKTEQSQTLVHAPSSLCERPLQRATQEQPDNRNNWYTAKGDMDRLEHLIGSRPLYLFDGSLHITASNVYPVTFHLARGDDTEIRRANLFLATPASPYGYWPH